MGTLYIVATPIGNLKDITLRAIEILKSVDAILTEDTRVAKKLLERFKINKETIGYHQHSPEAKKLNILNQLLQGKNLALVTDAGTPGISDPGNELINFLINKGPTLVIVPIPGASAVTAALSVSGFRSDKFIFVGFFPRRKREKLIKWLIESKFTFAFFESPKRIVKTLTYLEAKIGDRQVFVARELTKLHESIYRGTIAEVIKMVKSNPQKGEYSVVVSSRSSTDRTSPS